MKAESRRIRSLTNTDNSRIQLDRLSGYLREHLPALGASPAPIHVERCAAGNSNLTYLVQSGGVAFVLRRPPPGPLLPRAHDVVREYRWLAAMHPLFPLAPRPYLLCEDATVIGAPFFVMERRRGLIVRDEEPASLVDRPEHRRAAGEAVINTLAALHAIDVSSGPVSALGKPAGFLDRQVRGWTQRWHRAETSSVPEMQIVSAWLRSRLPPDPPRAAIVHGDFKLDNLMLNEDATEVAAVLDWEMCALGDPLVDLGILLAYWAPTAPSPLPEASVVTSREGWLSREEIIARYARRTGRELSNLRYYEVFALFKIAVVVQQLYRRFIDGRTAEPRFAHFGERVAFLARRAAASTDAQS